MDNVRTEIREKFKVIFENSFQNIFVYDLEGIIIDVNEIILDTFGYKREDVINKSIREFIRKEDLSQAINSIEEIRKFGKTIRSNIYRINDVNGSEKILEIHGIPYKTKGEIKAIIAFGQDITDKKKAEDLLKESESRFRTAIESLPFDFFALDKNERYFMQNTVCIEHWGNIIGKKPEDVAGEETLKIWKNNNMKALSGEVIKEEVCFPINNKKTFIFNIISPIKTENEISGILGVNIDITDLKETEQKLIESEKRYRNLFNNSPYSIVLLNLEGIIVDVNETATSKLGFKRNEVIGNSFLELPLYEPHMIPYLNHRLKQYASGKKMKPIVLPLKTKDGTSFWVNPNVSLIEINGVQHIRIIYEDITDKIVAEHKLKESEKKYRIAYKRENFYKDIFAHDTRNILQGILSSIELCKIGIKNSKNLEIIEELLDECKQQVLRGSNLVKNVKKFSELEDSKRPLMKINLIKFINEAIKITQTYSNEKDINISLDSESDQFYIKADELITDVFENVIINAIQHNPKKNVMISINVKENKEKKIQIEFSDNGPGIPDYKKEIIFKRNDEKDTSVSGTGLGLFLVSSIIKDYNANIEVKNRIPNDYTKGSTFVLTFPQILIS